MLQENTNTATSEENIRNDILRIIEIKRSAIQRLNARKLGIRFNSRHSSHPANRG